MPVTALAQLSGLQTLATAQEAPEASRKAESGFMVRWLRKKMNRETFNNVCKIRIEVIKTMCWPM